MLRVDVLNRIASNIGAEHYLEIGVQGGETFRNVAVSHKVGVDPTTSSAATIHEPSDKFFSTLDPSVTFDLVFVDGLHHADQVERDVDNAIKHLTPGGVIVCHDCNPPTEDSASRSQCGGVWCGDVWRAWVALRARLDARMFVVDTDLGCGVIIPDADPSPLDRDPPTTWGEFARDRAHWLNLITVAAFRQEWPLPSAEESTPT